ncbi:P-II family nitrogen regulator [Aerococcus mictus]|uniref:P-II family nitrogen regulator n=1 Tax=Aerococcus mictus TaxID=2976810 RepID=UPI002FD75C51
MVRIEAFIQPHKVSKVVAALHGLPKFPGFTLLDAHGQGHGRGVGGEYAYEPSDGLLYHKRVALIVLCDKSDATLIATTIAQSAHTGNKGDGFLSVSEVSHVTRIRQSGGEA